MQGIVLSKDGSIGYIMQGCNEQSRRRKGCQREIKPVVGLMPINIKEDEKED